MGVAQRRNGGRHGESMRISAARRGDGSQGRQADSVVGGGVRGARLGGGDAAGQRGGCERAGLVCGFAAGRRRERRACGGCGDFAGARRTMPRECQRVVRVVFLGHHDGVDGLGGFPADYWRRESGRNDCDGKRVRSRADWTGRAECYCASDGIFAAARDGDSNDVDCDFAGFGGDNGKSGRVVFRAACGGYGDESIAAGDRDSIGGNTVSP